MATHSSVLAWRIPGTGEPGGLPSMGLHRVRHNWSDLAVAAAYSDILNRAKIKWLSLSFFFGGGGIKISIIHQLENYLINISSHLLAQERSHIVFSFFLYFSRENLSISCWLLDWLQRDSLKILKKKIRNPVQIKHKLLSIMCSGHYVRFLLRKMSLKVAEINWCHWM